MIAGVGVDVVEIERIARAMGNPRFAERILTPAELDDLEPLTAERLAGRWAAKEAVAKAVSNRLRWHDVEISNDESGVPMASIALEVVPLNCRIHLSISHSRDTAVAFAVLERIC